MPVAFVAAAVYSRVLQVLLERWPALRLIMWPSVAVLAMLVLEWIALVAVGPTDLHRVIGPAFLVVHFAVFLLSLPALATILVVARPGTVWGSWGGVGLCCAVLALPVVLTQYGVSEAIFGME